MRITSYVSKTTVAQRLFAPVSHWPLLRRSVSAPQGRTARCSSIRDFRRERLVIRLKILDSTSGINAIDSASHSQKFLITP